MLIYSDQLTEVMTYIHNLNPSTHSGPDEIPLKYIKLSKEIRAPFLVELFNNSVCSETFQNRKLSKNR